MVVSALKNGAVLVMPTDTVYGLVCDAKNEAAIEKIFLIKKRPKTKPLLMFTDSLKSAKKIAEISKAQEEKIKGNWPGKTTFILNAKMRLSATLMTGETIGIRVPEYKFLADIVKKMKGPLAQTSANISGNPAATEIKEIIKQFEGRKNRPDLIIDAGDLPKNKPSSIINVTEGNIKIIRK